MVVWEPSGVVGNLPHPLPEKFTLDDEPVDVKNAKTPGALEVFPTNADGEPSHDERSLHAPDLLPGALGTDTSFPTVQQRQQKQQEQQQQHAKPTVIHVEEKDSQLSETSLQNTYSVEGRGQGASALADDKREEGKKNVFTSEQDGLGFKGESNGAVELEEEDIEPQQPTKIQVMLPSVDNSVHEESSVASDAHVSVDQDTFGDVSSISGGDYLNAVEAVIIIYNKRDC